MRSLWMESGVGGRGRVTEVLLFGCPSGAHSQYACLSPADPDIYSKEYQHPLWLPKGHLRRLTKGPCYDPSKGARALECFL